MNTTTAQPRIQWSDGDNVDLRKMRKLAGRWIPVSEVNVWEHQSGGARLQLTFDGGGDHGTYRNDWCSLSILAQALRQWRNLGGAPLLVEGEPAGVVGRKNSKLAELANK